MQRAILYCIYIYYVTAAIVQEKTTNLKERDFFVIPGDDSIKTNNIKTYLKQEEQDIHKKKSINKNKSSLEDAGVKINETDLYENGQEAKEKNERSFVIINQKFKSQRLKARQNTFFDDGNNSPDVDAYHIKKQIINAEDIIQSTHKNEIEDPGVQYHNEYKIADQGAQYHNEYKIADQGAQYKNEYKIADQGAQYNNEYKTGTSYFRQVPEALARAHNESEYVELIKRPLVRPFSIANNDRVKVSRPVKEFFRSHVERLDTHSLFNLMDSDDLVNKNTLGDDDIHSIPFESIEDDAKFDQHLKSALRDITSNDKVENKYNCYNSKCKAALNKVNKILINGVKVGLRCLCVEAVLRDRTGTMKNNVAPIGGYTTELSESEEAVVNETSKLMKMGDENVSAK